MKTFNSFNIKNISYIFLVVLGFSVVSCGSYSNSSYYDNDGIYSNSSKDYNSENITNEPQNNPKGSYFTQFQSYDVVEEEPVGIFTDVDTYYGEDSYSSGYSGWGNSTNDVTVNVYGGGLGWGGWYGSYWGWGNPYWSIGWGWNSWYYPYWGWNYGWGWSSWHNPYWGYYSPYYGGHYYYNRAPRNRYYSDYGYGSRYRTTNTNTVRENSRAYEVRSRSQQATGATRSNSRFTTDASRSNTLGTSRSTDSNRNSTLNNTQPRTNSNRNSTINSNRNSDMRSVPSRNSNSNRNNTITPSRSSSSPSMGRGSSMGGSRSSGTSGGGGRSSSGGRR